MKRNTANIPGAFSTPGVDTLDDSVWARVGRALCLSERETLVLRGLCAGDPERLIARALGLSTHTVHTYVGRIYRKLGVNSRSSLAMKIHQVLSPVEEGPPSAGR